MATEAARRKTLGAKLLAERIRGLEITYDEAAQQLRRLGADKIGRASICHWATGIHAPSRRNAEALATWSRGKIPSSSWDTPEPVKEAA